MIYVMKVLGYGLAEQKIKIVHIFKFNFPPSLIVNSRKFGLSAVSTKISRGRSVPL